MQLHEDKEYVLPNEMTLIMYGRNSNFKHPTNAVVYDTTGKEIHRIEAPFFKTDQMIHGIKKDIHFQSGKNVWIIHPHKDIIKNFWGKIIEEKPQRGFLDAFMGIKIIEEKAYAEMMISDGDMYFEFQYLDIESFHFLENARWGGRF